MKRLFLLSIALSFFSSYAQEHFNSTSTSTRGGVINVLQNPAELGQLPMKADINLFSTSFAVSGNKVGLDDLFHNDYFDEVLLAGSEPVNLKVNALIVGPSAAFRVGGWGFAIISKAHIQANVINADPVLARALTNSDVDELIVTPVNFSENQRLNATSWGEISLGVGHKLFENDKHRFNGGASLNLLFPGSYANIGVSALEGTITNNAGDMRLNNATGSLNFAYSGPLGENFESTDSYSKNIFGGLRGFSADIGMDYRLKLDDGYRLKAGFAVKNLGSMRFKSDNNYETNYSLSIQDPNPNGGLDLNQFEDVESVEQAEQILLQSGYLDRDEPTRSDFKIGLPTLLNLYADVRIVRRFHTTLFLQQKLQKDTANDQIASQNIFTLTPRFTTSFFEACLPVSFSEYSNTSVGLGLRAGGFFLGSSSLFTALGNGKALDLQLGFRFAI